MADLYAALLHHPVYDKNGAVVTTAVTNMDVHDFGRLARTYDLRAFYVATPVPTLRRLVERIIRHWDTGPGATYNHTRKEALALARLAPDLDAVLADIERETGVLPRLIATSAREGPPRLGFAQLRQQLRDGRLWCAAQFMHQRIAIGGRNQHFRRAGLAVRVRILARLVDVERVVGVLQGRHLESVRDKARDHPGQESRLARAAPAGDADNAHAVVHQKSSINPAAQCFEKAARE